MGDLILFSRATNGSSREVLPAGESAEILFFTGVRYYRMPDAVEATPTKRVRRKASRSKRVTSTAMTFRDGIAAALPLVPPAAQ